MGTSPLASSPLPLVKLCSSLRVAVVVEPMLLLLVRVRPRAILLMVLAVLLAESFMALAIRDWFVLGVSGTDLGLMGVESALAAPAPFWISISLFVFCLLKITPCVQYTH